MGSPATETPTTYTAVPLAGLVTQEPVPFALYLNTADHAWVLYQKAGSDLDESHLGRLTAEGIGTLFIRDVDRGEYFQRIEARLDQVLLDRNLPVQERADLLCGVATRIAVDLFAGPPDRDTVARAQKAMMSTSALLLRENQGFRAVRRVLTGSPGIAQHSLRVGFVSMGLARLVFGADPNSLSQAGIAGLLHDVGKIGREGVEHDTEHTTRGAAYLRRLGLPVAVVEVARWHHECLDGSGFPDGLGGEQIPELARIVGLVETFDKIHSAQQPRVGVFDALRILAEAYRGCFESRLAQGLVKLFR